MTDQEIAALAATGATTIVAAMATDSWPAARDGAAELFHRHNPESASAAIETQLDSGAAFVARAGDADLARSTLIGQWQLELAQLLTGRPEAGGDLRGLADQIRMLLPTAQRQWVQHNTARDHGIINALQGPGTQHVYYMDQAQPPAWPTPDEVVG